MSIECLIHGEDCLHCGEACRLEHEILRKQLAGKENEIQRLVDSHIDEESMLRKQLAEKDAEIAAMRRSLNFFGTHHLPCEYGSPQQYKIGPSENCTCGLIKAFSSTSGKEWIEVLERAEKAMWHVNENDYYPDVEKSLAEIRKLLKGE